MATSPRRTAIPPCRPASPVWASPFSPPRTPPTKRAATGALGPGSCPSRTTLRLNSRDLDKPCLSGPARNDVSGRPWVSLSGTRCSAWRASASSRSSHCSVRRPPSTTRTRPGARHAGPSKKNNRSSASRNWPPTGTTPRLCQRAPARPAGQSAVLDGRGWWEEVRDLINTAVSECFPPTASAGTPTEIIGLLEESSQRGPGSSRRAQAAFAPLCHALHVHLRHQESTDQYERQQIAIQREERHKSLDAARIRPRGGGPGQPGLPGGAHLRHQEETGRRRSRVRPARQDLPRGTPPPPPPPPHPPRPRRQGGGG